MKGLDVLRKSSSNLRVHKIEPEMVKSFIQNHQIFKRKEVITASRESSGVLEAGCVQLSSELEALLSNH